MFRARRSCVPALLCLTLLAPTAHALESRVALVTNGPGISDQYGWSVAAIGDFNGDGYGDFIGGAQNADSSGVVTGRAFIHFGGPSGGDGVADIPLRGEAASDSFGYSVASAGDFNGDGFADVIVGAPGNDAGGTSAGRAYIYYGGLLLDGTADLTLTGTTGQSFGYAVGGGGDVNGDGFDDVIVGAPKDDATFTDGGRALLYLGGSIPNANADLTLTGVSLSAQTGASVALLPTFNGDRFADIALGSPLDDVPGVDAGRVDVYFGSVVLNATSDLTLNAATAGDDQGWAIASAGDMNSDGFSDLLVGSPLNDTAASNAGRAQVFLGGSAPDATADLTVTGLASGDQFGQSVAGVGDVNGDGFDDVVAGATLADVTSTPNAGSVTLFLGATTLNSTSDATFVGRGNTTELGFAVGGGFDVDGDALDDIIAGEPFISGSTGSVLVLETYNEHLVSPNGGERWLSGSTQTVRWLGRTLADIALSTDRGRTWVTMLQGRGGDDENVAVVQVPEVAETTTDAMIRVTIANSTASAANSDASDRPFAIVVPEPVHEIASRVLLTLNGTIALSHFGSTVRSIGDFNGDGYDDFAIGAPDANSFAGQAYVFLGGPALDATPDLVMTGRTLGENFGKAIAGADVNNDGFSDLLISAPGNDSFAVDAGVVRLYFGSATPDTVTDESMFDNIANDGLGGTLASVGDMNGDGFEDLYAGTLGFSSGAGAVRVLVGGLFASFGATIRPPNTGAAIFSFGKNVAGLGDVNGDGFPDAAITDATTAYIYLGAAAFPVLPLVTLTGVVSAIAGAGDVNGDGFADILTSASNLVPGIADVFFGGPRFDGVADVVLQPYQGFFPGFGQSIVGPGDVNGDGFADVVVGSEVSPGEAFVFFGGPTMSTSTPRADLANPSGIADLFGEAVAAGDFTGDGFPDVVVAAIFASSEKGRAYVFDLNRYHVTSPIGGETWNVGATRSVTWLGAELADIRLSVDGGNTYETIASGVGGSASNAYALRVPHAPTKFARIRVAPHDPAVRGFDTSDSSFTIQSSIALLSVVVAPAPDGGVQLTWSTDPGVGPDGLTGYRVYRVESSGAPTLLTPEILLDAAFRDADGTPGTTYQIAAVNGLGEEIALGTTALQQRAPLAAWPVPYRRADGALTVSYRAIAGLDGAGVARVALYDARGRLVRTLVDGAVTPGQHELQWDGRDAAGRPVVHGVFTLRLTTAGDARTARVLVMH